MSEQVLVRVALRVEGDMWVAYCAKVGTMDNAWVMGSIAMRFVADADRKRAFMDLMQASLTAMAQEEFGVTIDEWDVQKAPEHEKAGRS